MDSTVGFEADSVVAFQFKSPCSGVIHQIEVNAVGADGDDSFYLGLTLVGAVYRDADQTKPAWTSKAVNIVGPLSVLPGAVLITETVTQDEVVWLALLLSGVNSKYLKRDAGIGKPVIKAYSSAFDKFKDISALNPIMVNLQLPVRLQIDCQP